MTQTKWNSFNRHRAKVKAIDRPSPIYLRVYTVLDKLGVDYTKTGSFSDEEREYFPIAMIGTAVIDAHGRHDGGWEDKKQRLSYHRKLDTMYAQTIPFLMGRNDWDNAAWEVNIKIFLSLLKAGSNPQIIGTSPRKKSSKRQHKRILTYE